MTTGTLLLALLLAQGHGTTKAAPKRASTTAAASRGEAAKRASKTSETSASAASDSGESSGGGDAGKTTTTADGKTVKSKTYNFTGLDVEGKLKTPQLLYFLNRVKLELDMSAPDKRSFMKELEKSADDKSL